MLLEVVVFLLEFGLFGIEYEDFDFGKGFMFVDSFEEYIMLVDEVVSFFNFDEFKVIVKEVKV